MAATSNSTSAPKTWLNSEPAPSLSELILAYRAHNDLGRSTSSDIWQAQEEAWGARETAMCAELAACKPASQPDVIAALELIADDAEADMFGAHHVSMLRHCAAFLSVQA